MPKLQRMLLLTGILLFVITFVISFKYFERNIPFDLCKTTGFYEQFEITMVNRETPVTWGIHDDMGNWLPDEVVQQMYDAMPTEKKLEMQHRIDEVEQTTLHCCQHRYNEMVHRSAIYGGYVAALALAPLLLLEIMGFVTALRKRQDEKKNDKS